MKTKKLIKRKSIISGVYLLLAIAASTVLCFPHHTLPILMNGLGVDYTIEEEINAFGMFLLGITILMYLYSFIWGSFIFPRKYLTILDNKGLNKKGRIVSSNNNFPSFIENAPIILVIFFFITFIDLQGFEMNRPDSHRIIITIIFIILHIILNRLSNIATLFEIKSVKINVRLLCPGCVENNKLVGPLDGSGDYVDLDYIYPQDCQEDWATHLVKTYKMQIEKEMEETQNFHKAVDEFTLKTR